MVSDSTPHAYPACSEADHAGTCFFEGKQSLTYDELWQHLLDKGLDSRECNKDQAVEIFARYGYYRLRGFWTTLEASEKNFKSQTSFDDILDIVTLDEELSLFIQEALRVIELALREALSYCLAQVYGPYPFRNNIFKDESTGRNILDVLAREYSQGVRCRLPFVMHYRAKGESLPIWAQVGLMSFGTISKVFCGLSDMTATRNMSKRFNLNARTMANWLRYLTQLRNMCAHQDRLYNIMFPVRPALFSEHKQLDNARLFPAFIVIFHMLKSIDQDYARSMRLRFGSIMSSHINVDLGPIGFPSNWRTFLTDTLPFTQSGSGKFSVPRKANSGRPRKNQKAIDEALFLYHSNQGTVSEIEEQTGVGHSTLYKYINMQKTGAYPRYEYAVIEGAN